MRNRIVRSRRLLLGLLAVLGLIGPSSTAWAVDDSGPANGSGTAGLNLIAQSPWIADDGDLALELRITGDAGTARLRVGLHQPIDRRGLADLHDGLVGEPLGPLVVVDVASTRNSAGVVSLILSVGPDEPLGSRPGGVYPLVVELVDPHDRVLDRLTTPLVHLPVVPEGEAASHRPLLVGLSVDVHGPPALRPDGQSTSTRPPSGSWRAWPVPCSSIPAFQSTSVFPRPPWTAWPGRTT